MVNNNPFAPAQVDIAGGVQNLMTQFQNQQKAARAQQVLDLRKSVAHKIMSGQGDPTSLIMGLAAQDPTGAAGLASIYKVTHPQAAVMSPYQSAQIEHDKVIEAQGADQKYLSGIPSSRKDYWISNPSAAPQRFRDAIGIGDTSGGDQGMPPETAQPTAAPAAPDQPPQLSYEKWHAIQTGKMLAPAEAEKHVNLVVGNLDNTRDFATKLLADPNLDKAFGGITTLLKAPVTGQGAFAGVGNVLPSWATAGTGIADVKSALDSLKDQISLAVIANMKEASGKAGSTGLGRVMQIEYNGWQNALGSLKEAQSPDAVRQSLRNIVSYIDKSKDNIQGALSKDYGTDQVPHGAVPQMDINQITQTARDLAQNQHMNKQQIIEWFAGKGIQLPP